MSKIKVGIVGLGLMGGSLSLALKQRSETYYFIGLDHNETHCQQATELGLVDEIIDSLEALKKCANSDITIESIGVDSWGVDFALGLSHGCCWVWFLANGLQDSHIKISHQISKSSPHKIQCLGLSGSIVKSFCKILCVSSFSIAEKEAKRLSKFTNFDIWISILPRGYPMDVVGFGF